MKQFYKRFFRDVFRLAKAERKILCEALSFHINRCEAIGAADLYTAFLKGQVTRTFILTFCVLNQRERNIVLRALEFRMESKTPDFETAFEAREFYAEPPADFLAIRNLHTKIHKA